VAINEKEQKEKEDKEWKEKFGHDWKKEGVWETDDEEWQEYLHNFFKGRMS
jgi:hypothetical protein